jgi:hypothetical protein
VKAASKASSARLGFWPPVVGSLRQASIMITAVGHLDDSSSCMSAEAGSEVTFRAPVLAMLASQVSR